VPIARRNVLTNATIFRLLKSRLKRECHDLDWIDDCDSLTVNSGFCTWLAECYNSPSPQTNEIVASDLDAGIYLYRWNTSFAVAMTGGDFASRISYLLTPEIIRHEYAKIRSLGVRS